MKAILRLIALCIGLLSWFPAAAQIGDDPFLATRQASWDAAMKDLRSFLGGIDGAMLVFPGTTADVSRIADKAVVAPVLAGDSVALTAPDGKIAVSVLLAADARRNPNAAQQLAIMRRGATCFILDYERRVLVMRADCGLGATMRSANIAHAMVSVVILDAFRGDIEPHELHDATIAYVTYLLLLGNSDFDAEARKAAEPIIAVQREDRSARGSFDIVVDNAMLQRAFGPPKGPLDRRAHFFWFSCAVRLRVLEGLQQPVPLGI